MRKIYLWVDSCLPARFWKEWRTALSSLADRQRRFSYQVGLGCVPKVTSGRIHSTSPASWTYRTRIPTRSRTRFSQTRSASTDHLAYICPLPSKQYLHRRPEHRHAWLTRFSKVCAGDGVRSAVSLPQLACSGAPVLPPTTSPTATPNTHRTHNVTTNGPLSAHPNCTRILFKHLGSRPRPTLFHFVHGGE
jgi:hypothetical protein